MSKNLNKFLSLFLSLCLILEQSVFAQTIDLSHYFVRNSASAISQSDKFRPLHLRYISYDNQANDFKILLDKGDFFNQRTPKLPNSPNSATPKLEETTQELMKYFFIGLALPNEKFWVNLRPDSPDDILDPDLEKTDIGRIFLEADLQLKKDTSGMTSPQTKEGKEYWDNLYQKAGELFGTENITIPTMTRPWIVPDEVIIRESPEGAYIYKATLKVMLEEDYLKSSQPSAIGYQQYNFKDQRLQELNQYSTQLIKETIIPKLTRQINASKRYAPLRQVYYSLILAQWFKQKYGPGSPVSSPRSEENSYTKLMDSGNLTNLTSSQPYDKQIYFQQYQKSFAEGEYNLQEPVYTPMGQSVRRYMSGGMQMDCSSAIAAGKIAGTGPMRWWGLKRWLIYLSVSLPLAIFPAGSTKAVTIDTQLKNVFSIKAVVENGESLKEVVSAVCRQLRLDVTEKDVDRYVALLRVERPYISEKDNIDLTKLVERIYVEDMLKKCEVISKKSIEVDGEGHDLYFVKTKDRKVLPVMGRTVGHLAIFINLEAVNETVESELKRKGNGFIPSTITESELFKETLKTTLMHELMHLLLYKRQKEGLETPFLDVTLEGWFGEVTPLEIYKMREELIAYLAQTLSSLYPKSHLSEFMVGAFDEDAGSPRDYIKVWTVIIAEVLNLEDNDPLARLYKLSDGEIKSRIEAMLETYFGKDIIAEVSRLLEATNELLATETSIKGEQSTSSALVLGWADNKIPEDEKLKIGEILGRCEMLTGFERKVWIQFGPMDSMGGANLIEEEGYLPLELKKQAKEGDGLIALPVSFPLFTEKQKEAVLWYLAAALAYGASESYGERFMRSMLEDMQTETIFDAADAAAAGLQLEQYSWGMDGGDWTMKKWNLIDWIATSLILTKMIKDGYGKQAEVYLEYLESAGKIYVTNKEAIEDNMSGKRGNFLLFVKDYVMSVLPFKLANNEEWAGAHLKQIEEIYGKYGLSEKICMPGNIKDLINNNSYPHTFTLGKVAEGINKNLASFLGIAGSPVVSEINPLQSNNGKGGIDLSRINKSIRAESVSSSAFGGGNTSVDVDFDLNEELIQLQKLLNAQIIPSADRLNHYARVARVSSLSSPELRDGAISLIAETFRLQEEKAVSASAELKALAAWLEQGT